ncbi:MAG: XrtA/PEP-CTERM system exopolysaccharide export protein [Gammaproteobacteria bacterium]|nr:XrtA/PEP-CTERM system exopolysaccharide export protein [Gammaproteobacteria bacterium]
MFTLAGCTTPKPDPSFYADGPPYEYIIGPGDSVNIFVWRNPEVSSTVTVRPDGLISTPLVEDVGASGKTPTQLARELEKVLGTYIKDPLVTVIVGGFNGRTDEQIRVVGEATQPRALPYSIDMTLLDVMIAVGGLTDFAAGNKTVLTRRVDGKQVNTIVRLEDLIRDGDITANVDMRPGDILIIPEAWF